MRLRKLGAAGMGAALALGLLTAPAQAAPRLDAGALQETLNAAHQAGMYGTWSVVRDGRTTWRGAAGVADVRTGRPVAPGMRHRVGSITKTFTAVAVLQQAARGRLGLDDPIGRHLPELVPGERGRRITVRMLLNHTSGIADFVGSAFPSLATPVPSGESLDAGRFRRFRPEQLARWGVQAPPTGEPGGPSTYSNTNYILAGLLLEKVTGTSPEAYITRHVIRPAGLRNTGFPRTAFIPGPHSKLYEGLWGFIDPPRDYSVYNMSWIGTAGAVVSTMDDLNRFYRELLTGRLLSARWLAEMQRTVTVAPGFHYGLGIYAIDLPCGRFWGHDGAVWGAGTQTLSDAQGRRQVSYAVNLMKYQRPDATEPHPIDLAMNRHVTLATCGDRAQVRHGDPAGPPSITRMHPRR